MQNQAFSLVRGPFFESSPMNFGRCLPPERIQVARGGEGIGVYGLAME